MRRFIAALTVVWPGVLAGQLPRNVQYPVAVPPEYCGNDKDMLRCVRRVELRMIGATGGVVRRSADTLSVFTRTSAITWVDTPQGRADAVRYFRYAGTLRTGTRHFVFVQRLRHETADLVMVNVATGDSAVIPGAPIVSPDMRRFIAWTGLIGFPFALDVWRIDADAPVREYSSTFPGHLPIDLAWSDSTTIRFRLGGLEDSRSPRRVELTLMRSGEWRVDSLPSDRSPR
jgi:hypothetical protein